MKQAYAKKPAASQGVNSELRRHSDLMREMDSPDGAWNPEPDGQISGILREDVDLSSNEMKLIAYVKACCVRLKRGGRSAFGKNEHGLPLTLKRIAEHFGWESGNASKHAKRPLAWGFVRLNSDGVFGLGARVQGTYTEGRIESVDGQCPLCGRNLGEEEKCAVCTYRIPDYIFDDYKRLSPDLRKKFVQGWVSEKQAAKIRFSEAAAKLRDLEIERLSRHCQKFKIELKQGKKRRERTGSPDVKTEILETGPERYVHTVADERSVHTENCGMYSAKTADVHTALKRGTEFFSESSELASFSQDENKLKETLNADVRQCCAHVPFMDGRPLDGATVENIVRHLLRLRTALHVREVLDLLDIRCRDLKRSGNHELYGWGYVVKIVAGEVNKRVGDPAADIGSQIKTAAAGKGMR